MTGVTYMNLASNQLSGQIPSSWAALTMLTNLYLGGNDLGYTAGTASGWSDIVVLEVQGNVMTSSQLDALVPDLVSAGVPGGGVLRLDGQSPAAPLNAPACAAVTTLQGLGWTINYDAGGAC